MDKHRIRGAAERCERAKGREALVTKARWRKSGGGAVKGSHSHGFRPGRRAHDAIREARAAIQNGKRWVVDVDLEKFFDRVNHDVLMGRLARRIEDRAMLRLIATSTPV